MYQEIQIRSLDDLFPLLKERAYEGGIGRFRSNFVYHGTCTAAFRLSTSLQRNCKGRQAELEPSILRNFSKYAASDDPDIDRSVWRQLIIGQHHGLPTRLLDWTYSPLNGLHFAGNDPNLEKMDKHDCIMWKIDVAELHAMLPERYREVLRDEQALIYTVKMLDRLCPTLEQYDRDMDNGAMLIMEPPSIDQRIINQYSYFSVVPHGMQDVEEYLKTRTANTVKYVIDRGLRWEISDMLDQFNITERTIYPELDGLTKMLARHYFVKD